MSRITKSGMMAEIVYGHLGPKPVSAGGWSLYWKAVRAATSAEGRFLRFGLDDTASPVPLARVESAAAVRAPDLAAAHAATLLRRLLRLRFGYRRCLAESVGLAAGLRVLGHNAVIVIGYATFGVDAGIHAWVVVEGVGLVAERPDVCESHRPIAAYEVNA